MKISDEEKMFIGRSLNKSPLRSYYGTSILSRIYDGKTISMKQFQYLKVAIQYNNEQININKRLLFKKINQIHLKEEK